MISTTWEERLIARIDSDDTLKGYLGSVSSSLRDHGLTEVVTSGCLRGKARRLANLMGVI